MLKFLYKEPEKVLTLEERRDRTRKNLVDFKPKITENDLKYISIGGGVAIILILGGLFYKKNKKPKSKSIEIKKKRRNPCP